MSNYVLTLKLNTSNYHENIINKRLEIARNIYNANVREIIKRDRKMRHDPEYRTIKTLKSKKEQNAVYKSLRDKYEVSKYSMMKFTTSMNRHFAENMPADVGHNQSVRAFQAYEKVRYQDGKQMRFKKYGQVNSLEGKSNTGIAYKNGSVYFNTRKSNKQCIIPVQIDKQDTYVQQALHDEIRYCRIVRKMVRGNYQYVVQLIMKGTPPNKHMSDFSITPDKKVGIDIGTSTVAVVSEDSVQLKRLSKDIWKKDRALRRLNRQLDRQRRANNPAKFAEDGTIIKNKVKWQNSNRYLKTKAKRQDVYRKLQASRKIAHQTLANKIVKTGTDIRVENMSFKGLQAKAKETSINETTGKYNKKKRFGKSLGLNAPALLISEIDKKLNYFGNRIKRVNTYSVKASQYNHITNEYKKKKLNERWNIIENDKLQRDLYSAFLIMNTTDDLENIDRTLCIKKYARFKQLHDQCILD